MQGITIGQYIPGDSIIHKADPRLKIIMTFFTMILLLIIDSFYPLLLSAVFVCCLSCSGISLRYAIKGLKPVIYIVIFTMILNIFFATGTPLLLSDLSQLLRRTCDIGFGKCKNIVDFQGLL